MGLRFQKRIKILPGLHLNLGKNGTSFTIGRPGASINVGGKRGARATVGIPGTGLSYSTKIKNTERTMALIKCRECNNDISGQAKTCPQCGAKVKKTVGLGGLIFSALFGYFIFSINYTPSAPVSQQQLKLVEKPKQTPTVVNPNSIIIDYGNPDDIRSTEYDNPRPPLVTRTLEYSNERVRFTFVPTAQTGSPPPYASWYLMGFQDTKDNSVITIDEVNHRMLASGRIRRAVNRGVITMTEAIQTTPINPAPIEQQHIVPVSPWSYSTHKDTDPSKTYDLAEINSMNKEDLRWPYGEGIGAKLLIVHRTREENKIILLIDKGQIQCHSFESCAIGIVGDDRPMLPLFAVGPNDGSSDKIVFTDYKTTFNEIKRAKKLTVTLPLYEDGPHSWTFNVNDLKWIY